MSGAESMDAADAGGLWARDYAGEFCAVVLDEEAGDFPRLVAPSGWPATWGLEPSFALLQPFDTVHLRPRLDGTPVWVGLYDPRPALWRAKRELRAKRRQPTRMVQLGSRAALESAPAGSAGGARPAAGTRVDELEYSFPLMVWTTEPSIGFLDLLADRDPTDFRAGQAMWCRAGARFFRVRRRFLSARNGRLDGEGELWETDGSSPAVSEPERLDGVAGVRPLGEVFLSLDRDAAHAEYERLVAYAREQHGQQP